MSIGTLAVRGVVGPLFVGHGTQKLFGWFGGHGLEKTSVAFEQMGLRPGKRNAVAAGVSEALGGLLLTLGAFTPVAGTMIASTMATAMRKVHLAKGPWVTDGGFEYNAVLIAAVLGVVDHGPGRASIDHSLFPEWKGARWALAAGGAAVAGSYLVDRLTDVTPEQDAEASFADASASDERAEPRFNKETSAGRS